MENFESYGYISDAEKAFAKFIHSGYDAASVPLDDVHHVATQWAIRLVPWHTGFREEQESRSKQWPWVMAWFVGCLRGECWRLESENRRLKEQLIEHRKELSKLKRATK